MTSAANKRLISSQDPASMRRSMTSYISNHFRWSYGTISSMDRPGLGSWGWARAGVWRHDEGM
jgi:hypothetical protein